MVATANTKMNPSDNAEYFSRYRFARRWAARIERYILSKTDRLIVSLERSAIELGMEAAYKRFSQYVIQPRPGMPLTPAKSFCRTIAMGVGSAWAKECYIHAARLHRWPQGSPLHSVSWSIGVTMGAYLALRHYAERMESKVAVPNDLTEIDPFQPCQCSICKLAQSIGGNHV
jgi:hypothetical protein